MRARSPKATPKGPALVVLGAVVAAVLVGGAAVAPADAENPCDGTLQALVDAAEPGATVETPGGCVYRETVTIDKPITLRAGPGGTEVRGSEVWDAAGWSQRGAVWVSSKAVPKLAVESRWQCEAGTNRCRWPEQVFIDGGQLSQVAAGTTPGAGQFALDAGRRVVLGQNPAGRGIEVTERNGWVRGIPGGSQVTINGFSMKHAGGHGLDNDGNADWTIVGGDYSHAHASNLQLKRAAGLVVLGSGIHHAGQTGVAGNYASMTLRGNDIYGNNTEDFKSSWSAGGVKAANPRVVTFDGNVVHHNRGNGLWLDVPIDDQLLVVKNNRVHHNDANGIRSEVTDDDVRIHGNVVWGNGWGRAGTREAGISVNASHDNHVHDNVVAWNKNGIRIINSLRTEVHPEETEYDLVHNIEVDNNDVLMGGPADGPSASLHALSWAKTHAGGNLYDPAANNRGHDNRYWYPAAEDGRDRYAWTASLGSLDAFNDTPGEENGRYLSDAEKDGLVALHDIPASPADAGPPTTTATPVPAPDAAGWNRDDVSVTLSASDGAGGSGIREIAYSAIGAEQIAPQTVPGNSATLDLTAEGRTTVSFRATDNAGNVEPQKTLAVKLDKTAPTVDIRTPSEGASYTLNRAVYADYSCADGTAGISSCQGPVPDGNAMYTGSTGTHTFTAVTTDNAGNQGSATRTYVVDEGSSGGCTIVGGAGGETLTGTPGDDVICGGGGNDTVRGLGGNDVLKGEDGNDALSGGAGDDTLEGGPGVDTASYADAVMGVNASLGTGSATGEGADAFRDLENLQGSPQADTLLGSGANNALTGGAGVDTARGGAGNDRVTGGGGADRLYGEAGSDAVDSKDGVRGNDSLDGGSGTDTKTTDASEKSIVGFP